MKKLIMLALSLLGGVVYSQTLPLEPKSNFKKDGVIYWHKDLPYYVFVSTDSTNEHILLHSKDQSKYSNPSYFDTYGFNYIRTKWAVDKTSRRKANPEQEIKWEVFVDGDAPETKPNFVSNSSYLVGGVRYFTKDLVMELVSKDIHSGVRSTYFSVNDSAYIKYAAPIKLNPTDTFKVKYFSVDNVGNYEKIKHFTYAADDYSILYAIDAFAPETNILTNLHRGSLGPNIKISFKSKDRGTGVAFTNYRIDDGELIRYSEPFTLNLANGVHTISWMSVDRIENMEKEKSIKFMFSSTKPEIFINAKGEFYSKDSVMFINAQTKIKLCAQSKLGIKRIAYKFDSDRAYQGYSDPIVFPAGKNIQHLRYFATDSIDNDSDVHVIKLEKDTGKPKINIVITGAKFIRNDTTYVTPQTAINRANYDSLSGIKWDSLRVNGVAVNDIRFEDEIPYLVEDDISDNVNNKNSYTKIFKCDSNAPIIEFHFSSPAIESDVYPNGTILFLAIKDKTGVGTFKIKVDGKLINGTTFTGKTGSHTVEVIAADLLDQSATKSIIFTLR